MTQRVVVIGATGQIGRPLCLQLMRAGHAVVVFSRDLARARHLAPGAVGYVLTPASLASQVGQFRRHLGGWIGTGRCWTPCIHIDDEVGIIAFVLQQPGVDGPVNLTAPQPARAREFAQALGRAVSRRAWLMVPSPLARLGLGVITDILSRGKRVIPARARALGYQFSSPGLDAALHDLLDQPDDSAAAAR
jgi:NAD dependent epimerase/dehydratase family enzyme